MSDLDAMDNFNARMDQLDRELEAGEELAKAIQAFRRTPVVDDDFPQVKRRYERAARDFIAAHTPTEVSVIQSWVSGIPLRQQGVLILALRGPDGSRKESAAKPVIRSLRGCTMNSGREGVPMARGQTFDGDSFMRMDLICDDAVWQRVMDDFYGSIDEHNIHFIQHLLHAAAVLGFNHPDPQVAANWLAFYHKGVHKLHMNPETREQFTHRLRNGVRKEEDE